MRVDGVSDLVEVERVVGLDRVGRPGCAPLRPSAYSRPNFSATSAKAPLPVCVPLGTSKYSPVTVPPASRLPKKTLTQAGRLPAFAGPSATPNAPEPFSRQY